MTYQPVTKKKEKVKPIKEVGLLNIRTANECIENAKKQAIPHKHYGLLWYENEVAILFSDTNLGKSILSVQVADSISRGLREGIFCSEAPPQIVLYFDFELSDKQCETRYSMNFEKHYVFDDNLIRIQVNPDFTDFEKFEIQLFEEIEQAIVKTGAKVLIIDNITFLSM